jgi:parallel beta-helix repeat protein
MSESESSDRKAAYSPSNSKHLWPLAILGAALALGGLPLASWRHEVASQTPGVTPTSVLYLPHEIASQSPEVTPTSVLYLPLTMRSFFGPPPTYYVDSSLGSDGNSCTLAQNPSTPKRTVSGVMSCNPGPGEIVRFRGVFRETIYPTRSGTVLYGVQDIAQVNGSVVTFTQAIAEINPSTDYVAIYGSRKGNSGAFAVVSVSGNCVTVNTADLPAGQFMPEVASDPGALQAAILRPVHFTAWDSDNPPVWDGDEKTFHSINKSVIMLSHIKSLSGWPRTTVAFWAAVEIDGNDGGNSDFHIFDHLEIVNAEVAIGTENHEFHSNYDIIQFNTFHDTGYTAHGPDEVIYFGNAYHPERHHDYAQIMYNKIGPHKQDYSAVEPVEGDGIEIKHSAHNVTVFGNEIVGIEPNGCDDAPIKISGPDAFVANNYLHNINPQANLGCGISIVNDLTPYDPTLGGNGTIVANNIIANVKRVGIRVLDTSNIQILNNTIYNILPEPDCDPACMEDNMGIEIKNYQGPTENIVIKNNIVQAAYVGIGRYIWSNDFPVSIDSDYNLVFDSDFPFRGTITQNTHDRVMDPELVDPQNHNFALMATSPARDSGRDLTTVIAIDNHDAGDPSLPAITAPIIRTGVWDIGAYEYEETQPE